jgi:hypothetical protein
MAQVAQGNTPQPRDAAEAQKPTTCQDLSQLSGRLRYAWPTRFALILAEGQQLNYSLLYPRLDK